MPNGVSVGLRMEANGMTTPPTPKPPLSPRNKAALIFVVVGFAFALLMMYISRDPAEPRNQSRQTAPVSTPPVSVATNQPTPTPNESAVDSNPVLFQMKRESEKWQAALDRRYSEEKRKAMYFEMSYIIYAADDEADAICGSDQICWRKENRKITDRMVAAFDRKYKLSYEEGQALAVEGMGRWPTKGRDGHVING